ncbi:MAG: orotidine-5'-phosphate decarboxylase [Desulfobacterales bacterium]|jgi:orotidine-5'-phosphate decarboxylase|nr:orotidine-5'-phosphate decarboxylase [Desulfobacterales bacterium]
MKQAKDYIIFPLDVATVAEARHYAVALKSSVGMFKVGLELFIRSGPEIINMIRSESDAGIFLDLKLHDIPETVRRAMAVVADLGVTIATVHCGESPAMLEAAVAGSGGRVGVLGVTVLTSVSAANIQSAGFKEEFSRDLSRLVLKRALAAKAAGMTGIVCSGLEVKTIKAIIGREFICVTPGIRMARELSGADDQHRVATPAEAVRNGSDYLVIGRPIRDAKDPVAAADRIAEEIAGVI